MFWLDGNPMVVLIVIIFELFAAIPGRIIFNWNHIYNLYIQVEPNIYTARNAELWILNLVVAKPLGCTILAMILIIVYTAKFKNYDMVILKYGPAL